MHAQVINALALCLRTKGRNVVGVSMGRKGRLKTEKERVEGRKTGGREREREREGGRRGIGEETERERERKRERGRVEREREEERGEGEKES